MSFHRPDQSDILFVEFACRKQFPMVLVSLLTLLSMSDGLDGGVGRARYWKEDADEEMYSAKDRMELAVGRSASD